MTDWSPEPIYDEVRAKLLFDPLPPARGWFETDPAAAPAADDLSGTDHLVQRTDNGLRPEDLALPQPPQDAGWRPT